jgi:hypothetical protein
MREKRQRIDENSLTDSRNKQIASLRQHITDRQMDWDYESASSWSNIISWRWRIRTILPPLWQFQQLQRNEALLKDFESIIAITAKTAEQQWIEKQKLMRIATSIWNNVRLPYARNWGCTGARYSRNCQNRQFSGPWITAPNSTKENRLHMSLSDYQISKDQISYIYTIITNITKNSQKDFYFIQYENDRSSCDMIWVLKSYFDENPDSRQPNQVNL